MYRSFDNPVYTNAMRLDSNYLEVKPSKASITLEDLKNCFKRHIQVHTLRTQMLYTCSSDSRSVSCIAPKHDCKENRVYRAFK